MLTFSSRAIQGGILYTLISATYMFTSFFSQINRKRLVKALFTVHRNRTDLLPFYARLVGTLNPCMPDVATQLCAALKQDFRYQFSSG